MALTVATMTQLVGPRVILGFGAGTFDHEFAAVGIDTTIKRWDLVESTARILNRVWTENNVDYKDDFFEFTDVTIEPKPLGGTVPFWYCGGTPASARRAVAYCDGWMPGRLSLPTFRARVEKMRELSSAAGTRMPTVAIIPPTSVEATREEALRDVNIEGLCAWANNAKFWVKPPSGRFETWEDLEGTLIAGRAGRRGRGVPQVRRRGM